MDNRDIRDEEQMLQNIVDAGQVELFQEVEADRQVVAQKSYSTQPHYQAL